MVIELQLSLKYHQRKMYTKIHLNFNSLKDYLNMKEMQSLILYKLR